MSLVGRALASAVFLRQAISADVDGRTLANAALLGLLLGLSLLSKVSALALLPLAALALGLAWWGERGLGARAWSWLALRGVVVLGLAGLVSGWWFLRNWRLYGDPLGWSVWLIDIGVQRIGLDELIRQFGHVATSYISPYDGLMPRPVFWALGVGLAVAVVGWIGTLLALVKRQPPLNPPRQNCGGEEETLPLSPPPTADAQHRSWSHRGEEKVPAGGVHSPSPCDCSSRHCMGEGRGGGRLTVDKEGLLLAGAWLVLLVVSLVRYMTTTPSAEGRLLYPGISAASLWVVFGWQVVLGAWRSKASAVAKPVVVGVVGVALLALSLVTPLVWIRGRFASPLVTDARELEGLTPVVDGEWGEVRLLGVRVEPEVAQPGERVEVHLYWEVLSEPTEALRAVVRLQTAGGSLLAQWDEPPVNERYPSDLWRAGEILRDDYAVPALAGLAITGGPAMYRVLVALPHGKETKQAAEAKRLAQTAYRFKLAPGDVEREPAGLVPIQYLLGERVELSGYRLPEGRTLSQDGLALTLYWDVLAEMQEDYNVFVHLVGPDGTLLGQGDGPPLGGDYPTSGWAAGEGLADTHVVRLKAEVELEALPEGAYLLVGLYRLKDGVRLPVVDGNGARVPQDAVRIELD